VKIIKPQRLGALTRVFEHDRTCHFVVSVIAFFPLRAPDVLLPEVKLWPFLGEALGKDAAFDLGMPKPRGEVLVFGKAFPPAPRPRPACSVRVRISSVDKTL
jgi:hypothetical protein